MFYAEQRWHKEPADIAREQAEQERRKAESSNAITWQEFTERKARLSPFETSQDIKRLNIDTVPEDLRGMFAEQQRKARYNR